LRSVLHFGMSYKAIIAGASGLIGSKLLNILLQQPVYDPDYGVKLVQLAKRNGAAQYHLVSSSAANSKSSNFFPKIKGEIEEAIEQVGLKCLHIYEPAFLTGNRIEHRSAERIFHHIDEDTKPSVNWRLEKIQEHTC
jgi:uncharacterized protein YbjT (DUF2867 family)